MTTTDTDFSDGVGSASGLLSDIDAPQRVLESEQVFDGRVWSVRRERFNYGDGEIVREFVDHTGAVAVLVMDDDDRVLLIKQYRHPIGQREWEIPAGLLDIDGEEPLEAAKRELAEEADLHARDWSPLCAFHTSPGGSNELVQVFLAKGVHATETAFERGEEEADIEQRWVPLHEVVDAVLAGRVRNSILNLAVLTLAARR